MSRQPHLIHPVQPIKIQAQDNVPELLWAMGPRAFQRDNLSPGVHIRGEMPKRKATIPLGLKVVAHRLALQGTADVTYRKGL